MSTKHLELQWQERTNRLKGLVSEEVLAHQRIVYFTGALDFNDLVCRRSIFDDAQELKSFFNELQHELKEFEDQELEE